MTACLVVKLESAALVLFELAAETDELFSLDVVIPAGREVLFANPAVRQGAELTMCELQREGRRKSEELPTSTLLFSCLSDSAGSLG